MTQLQMFTLYNRKIENYQKKIIASSMRFKNVFLNKSGLN